MPRRCRAVCEFYPPDFFQQLFGGRNPVRLFVRVEHKFEKQHHQKRSAERRNSDVRLRQIKLVLLGVVQRHIENAHTRNTGKHRDNRNRENKTHAENRNQNAPCQKSFAPNYGHSFQLGGVNDGVVEAQAYFERGDNYRAQHELQLRAVEVPAQKRERKSDDHNGGVQIEKFKHISL